MPGPTLRQGGFNIPVTNMAVGFSQSPADGAGWHRKMAPIVRQDTKRATYKVFNKGDWFRDEMVRRADGSPAAKAGYGMSDATVELEWFSLRHDITDAQKANWKIQASADQYAAKFLQQKALISGDRLAVTNLLTAGVGWGTELVGAASAVANTSVIGWSLANSTPRVDITDAIDTVRQRIGKKPNRLGVSPDVLKVLKRHSDFTSQVNGGATSANPGVVSESALEDILGLPRGSIFEMGTVYNSAAKGQTASMGYAVSEVAWIGYVPDAPALFEPAAAYTFAFNEIDGLAEDGAVAIYTYRDEVLRADAYEADLYHDVQLVSGDCGFLYTSILT